MAANKLAVVAGALRVSHSFKLSLGHGTLFGFLLFQLHLERQEVNAHHEWLQDFWDPAQHNSPELARSYVYTACTSAVHSCHLPGLRCSTTAWLHSKKQAQQTPGCTLAPLCVRALARSRDRASLRR